MLFSASPLSSTLSATLRNGKVEEDAGCTSAKLNHNIDECQMQSSNKEDYTIVGTDVEALFQSLDDLESARIVREAVEESGICFENIDIEAAFQYLVFCNI